jgi:hypothetical protein
MVKACDFGPFYPSTKNWIPLFVFHNLHNAQISKFMKRTMESNNGCALSLKLRMQLNVDAKQDLDKGAPTIGGHVDV